SIDRKLASASLFDYLSRNTAISLNGALWNIDSGAASLRLDVGSPDHLAPFLGFLRNEFPEIGGRARKHSAAKVGKAPAHRRIDEARIDLVVELIDDLDGCVLWNADAIPLAGLVARQELTQGRKVRQRRRALRGRYCQRAQPAGLDVLDGRGQCTEVDLQLPGHEVSQRGRYPAIRHMNHADAGHHLEQLAEHMGRASVAGGPHVDLARVGLRVGDEFRNRLGGKRRMYTTSAGGTHEARAWRDVADKFEFEVVVGRRVECVRRFN